MTARVVALAGWVPRRIEAGLNRLPGAWWSVILVGTYLFLVTWSLARHVMWRDEAQMWLIGRASGSLADLFQNMQYENRPALWFLLLWPISRISGNPEAIKVLTWLAAAGSAFVISRYLPLKRLEQVAVLSGFLFLLGYSTVSTGYMVGSLALLLWFVAFARGSLVGQFALAAVLGATHILFLLVAAPLWIMTAITLVRTTLSEPTESRKSAWWVAMLSAVTMAWSAWLILPPEDYGFAIAAPVPLSQAPLQMLEYAGAAIRAPGVALPRLLTYVPMWIWSIPVVVIVIAAAVRGRSRLIAPIVGLALIVANGVFGYGPYWWHSGTVVLVLLLVVLMTRVEAGSRWYSGAMLVQSLAWWCVLVAQVIASISVPGRDLWGAVPYSGAKATAQVIREVCPAGCPIVTNDDILSTSVSAYLAGTSLYSAETGRDGSFTVWDSGHLRERPVTWDLVRESLLASGPDSLAVLTQMADPPADFEVLSEPIDAVWSDEAFLVVRLSADGP